MAEAEAKVLAALGALIHAAEMLEGRLAFRPGVLTREEREEFTAAITAARGILEETRLSRGADGKRARFLYETCSEKEEAKAKSEHVEEE